MLNIIKKELERRLGKRYYVKSTENFKLQIYKRMKKMPWVFLLCKIKLTNDGRLIVSHIKKIRKNSCVICMENFILADPSDFNMSKFVRYIKRIENAFAYYIFRFEGTGINFAGFILPQLSSKNYLVNE